MIVHGDHLMTAYALIATEGQSMDERVALLEALADEATCFSSSSYDRVRHPAYRAVMTLGQMWPVATTRALLRRLQQPQPWWFWNHALGHITGKDVAAQARQVEGGFERITTSSVVAMWVAWGVQQGHLPGVPLAP